MQTKIDFTLTDEQIHEHLELSLKYSSDFHRHTELIARSVLDMMAAKNSMYGRGASEEMSLKSRITRAYYEGIGRKAARMPTMVDRILADGSDYEAKAQFLDTLIDVAGYAFLGLAAVSEEITKEITENEI